MLEGKEVGESLVCEETRVSSKGSLSWEETGNGGRSLLIRSLCAPPGRLHLGVLGT